MTAIDAEINILIREMNKVDRLLDIISEPGFDSQIKELNLRLEDLDERGKSLNKRFTQKELKNFLPQIEKKAKLIQEKLDSIIKGKNDELKSISSDLKIMSNQRKLANYFRE